MQNIEIYTKSDKFKFGWVAGFYDARSDDGMRYLDDILRYGLCSDDEKSFMAGYRAGQQVRRGEVRYNPEPIISALRGAARVTISGPLELRLSAIPAMAHVIAGTLASL